MTSQPMVPTLQRALEQLVPHFERDGWAPTGGPTSVLAMTKHPAPGVEHVLFVNEPWHAPAAPGAPDEDSALLACTVNVHFPTLEACINDALGRDASEAGRQSLRLALARLAPPQHLAASGAYAVTPSGDDDAADAGSALLRADFGQYLEPVRRQLCNLEVLGREPLPPLTMDPWTWHLRQAAYLHLHGDAAASTRFLAWLHAQAEQMLSEEAEHAEGATPPSEAGAGPAARQATRVHRAAEDALALADALRRPRRRVIHLSRAA